MKKSLSKDGNYAYLTIEEFAELIDKNPEKVIGFTNDNGIDDDEYFEPSGWYGVKYTSLFDGDTLLLGYFGSGVIDSRCMYLYGDDSENWTCSALGDLIQCNVDGYLDSSKVVCVDLDDLKKGE